VTTARARMGGLRAGVVVFFGVGVSNLSNYVFHLLSARQLGPVSYGDVATLAAVSGIVTLPLGGAQVFAARHVAAMESRGLPLNDGAYVSGFAGAMLLAGAASTAALLAVSPLIRSALSIHSMWAVVFTILSLAPSFLAPVLLGAIQGSHRFLLVAAAIGAPSALRVVVAAGALAAGLGVAGVMAATCLAALFALAIPFVALRRSLEPRGAWRPALSRSEALALLPVVAGTLAITCLSTDDLVAAKVSFSAHEAGLYGGASLIGRVILYLPVAVVTVLLPVVAARSAAGHATRGVFAQSLIATGALCCAFSAAYVLIPKVIVRVAYGSKYEGAAPLLWMFAVAMTLYSLLNVLLYYRLGQGQTRICWLLLGGAVLQAICFAGFHSSPRELLVVSMLTGAVLLFASVTGVAQRLPTAASHALGRDGAGP
jgi:O-antigen/teichoic acid export membrane protein